MKLSIVGTLYNSEPYIEEFLERVSRSGNSFAGDDFEVILVNDGSPDESLAKAISLTETNEHVRVVDLSRNFGHHKAIVTGLSYTKGDFVFLIDTDLEEQPEWLHEFSQQMLRDDSDMVFGVQEKRKGGVFERVSGWFYYRVFRVLTGINQPDNVVTARLMTRRFVDALLKHKEREVNLGGLLMITGFVQTPMVVNKLSLSVTTYSLKRKISHLVNAITSFSSFPLVLTFYSGLVISVSAFTYIGYLVVRYFLIAKPPDGYTSVIASIWLFSGLVILFLGIQGIYIAKIFSEVKSRPYTIVRHVYGEGHEHD